MSKAPKQQNRIAELSTPLGTDKLVLNGFTAIEHINQCYEIKIDCMSVEENIDFNKALGLHCCIRFTALKGTYRYFSGRLAEATWVGWKDDLFTYQIVLRPWLWLLKHTTDCRIFQNLSVPEIIKKVFDKAGFNDYELKLNDTYKPLEYCVQFQETHFDFVCRLMEQYGIFYFFTHEAGKHTLVLADGKGSLNVIPTLPNFRFWAAGKDQRRRDEEFVTEWFSGRAFRTGKVTVNAFDFAKPSSNLKTDKSSPGGYAHGSLEVYHYPEKYKQGQESDLGQKFASARLLSVQAEDRRRTAIGDVPSMYPGGLTSLVKHPTGSENKEYLVIAATHSFIDEAYRSGRHRATGDSYSGSYELQPSDRPYKAPLVTPTPKMRGPQTATVVGPSGEEIYTDEHGRVKLKFHWDRESSGDEKSSRWVRVAQIWSGKKWGGIVIPRIGMEVIVDFLEGDPDRPIVVGTVYNGDNKPPYELPANKTQAGMKSRSSKGGGDSNYNELVFEDKKDSELIRMHAEKDLDVTVEDGETRTIKAKNRGGPGEVSRKTTVEKGDDNVEVKNGDNNVKVSRHQKIKVGETIEIEAGTKITLKVGSSKIEMTTAQIKIETQNLQLKAMTTTIDSTTSLIEKSAIIKLN
jgi:type VI secretion system secreted protein VgrG